MKKIYMAALGFVGMACGHNSISTPAYGQEMPDAAEVLRLNSGMTFNVEFDSAYFKINNRKDRLVFEHAETFYDGKPDFCSESIEMVDIFAKGLSLIAYDSGWDGVCDGKVDRLVLGVNEYWNENKMLLNQVMLFTEAEKVMKEFKRKNLVEKVRSEWLKRRDDSKGVSHFKFRKHF